MDPQPHTSKTSRSPPPFPKGSRCEITPQVRTIAERTQQRMFKRTKLFFNEATFQVPNTVEEAFENMRQGTTDLDRNTTESTEGITELYLMSWSNTQFFSAQMAALGFRFISCNLRKHSGLETPPPVEQWLRLERFSTPLPGSTSSPLPQPSPSLSNCTSVSKPTVSNQQPIKSTNQSPAPLSNILQNSAATPSTQTKKRAPPADTASDQDTSPARKVLRGINGIRVPSKSTTNAEKADKTVVRKKTNQTPVPIIDLT